jgi:hypothetical protein
MQAHVGEEQHHFNVAYEQGDRKSRASISLLNHPLKSPYRMMFSLFEQPILER